MHTPLHIRGRISNLYERIMIAIGSIVSRNLSYIIVEGDSTVPDKHGEWPVSNAGITISQHIYSFIRKNVVETRSMQFYSDDPDYNTNPYYCLVYKAGGPFAFAINPDLTTYRERPILSPILYDPTYHCFGFQPCTPSTMAMLHQWHMPSTGQTALPCRKEYDETNCCWYYVINDRPSIFWHPIESLILRQAFRYADHRYNSKKRSI